MCGADTPVRALISSLQNRFDAQHSVVLTNNPSSSGLPSCHCERSEESRSPQLLAIRPSPPGTRFVSPARQRGVPSRKCASPAGTPQTVAGHGSARWEKMNCESREGRHNLLLGIEAVYSQKPRHLLSMADRFMMLALVGDIFHHARNLRSAHAAGEISFLPSTWPETPR